jgi:single-strand DNA-binding protein
MARLYLNNVAIAGNLTRDPEMKYTPGGQAVTSFSLAINEPYKDKEGKTVDKVTFVNCVIWGKSAEVMVEYCKKGDNLYVEGSISSRKWETKEKEQRETTEVKIKLWKFSGGDKQKKETGDDSDESKKE